MDYKLTVLIIAISMVSLSIAAPIKQVGNKKKDTVVDTKHWSGALGVTSNYIFLGISESNNLPAVQGSLTYSFPSTGFYLYTMGSNVNFPDIQGRRAKVEITTSAGISNDIGDNFKYDLYVSRYNYPNSSSSYNDYVGELTYYFIHTMLGYSNDVFNYHGNGTYCRLGLEHAVPKKYIFGQENVEFSGGVGRYFLPIDKGLSSYDYFDLQLQKTVGNFVLSLIWVGTNLTASDERSLQRPKLVAAITLNF